MNMKGTAYLVAGTVTGVETGQQGILTASSVVVQDILPVNVLQLMVVEGVVVGFFQILALVEVVAVEIALDPTAMMTVMMGDASGTVIECIAKRTAMIAVIVIAMKDTHLVVIALQVRDMWIGHLKLDMAKTKVMTGMEA